MCLVLGSFMSLCKSDMLAWFSFSLFTSGELWEPSMLGLLQSYLFRLVPLCSPFPSILFEMKKISSCLTPQVTKLRKTCLLASTTKLHITCIYVQILHITHSYFVPPKYRHLYVTEVSIYVPGKHNAINHAPRMNTTWHTINHEPFHRCASPSM